jgi:hypothetical protein
MGRKTANGFDDLAREGSTALVSRRQVLKGLGAGLIRLILAGLGTSLSGRRVDAQTADLLTV